MWSFVVSKYNGCLATDTHTKAVARKVVTSNAKNCMPGALVPNEQTCTCTCTRVHVHESVRQACSIVVESIKLVCAALRYRSILELDVCLERGRP